MKKKYIKPMLEELLDVDIPLLQAISNTSVYTTGGGSDPNKDNGGPSTDPNPGGGTGGMSRQGFFDEDYDF